MVNDVQEEVIDTRDPSNESVTDLYSQNWFFSLWKRRRTFHIISDALIIFSAFLISYYLRFNINLLQKIILLDLPQRPARGAIHKSGRPDQSDLDIFIDERTELPSGFAFFQFIDQSDSGGLEDRSYRFWLIDGHFFYVERFSSLQKRLHDFLGLVNRGLDSGPGVFSFHRPLSGQKIGSAQPHSASGI